jgi:[acyl-carrier-protein] S-malonyltransferase
MPTICFAFDGPASCVPLSGKDLYNKVLSVRDAMDRADKALAPRNFKVTKACFLGTAEDLSKPSIAGPASLAIAYGVTQALKQKKVMPQMLCGQGWGEISALACLGAIPYEETLHLLRIRGEWLEMAWAEKPFHVLAVTGLGAEALKSKLDALPQKPEIVSDDSPEACVLAGPESVLKGLATSLASRTVKCSAVSPGWAWPHPSFEPVSSKVREELAKLKAERSGSWDFYSMLNGSRLLEWPKLSGTLADATSRPIRLREGFAAMRGLGMDTLVEIGPSEHLGLHARALDKGIRALASLDAKSLSSALKLAV